MTYEEKMKQEPTLDEKFYEDLSAFRRKYPMCSINAFTPDDFGVLSVEDGEDPLPWTDQKWVEVATVLDELDNDEQNASDIRYALQEVEGEIYE